MNVPSYSALIDRDKLIKTVQELCEIVNELQAAAEEEPVEDIQVS